MRKRLWWLVLVVIGLVGFVGPAQACVTNGNSFSPTFRGNLIIDYNDYGLIFEDAKRNECSQLARQHLITKISTTGWHTDHISRSVAPFQGFLEGHQVALIFAAALMIGGHGDLNQALDDQLVFVRDSYAYNQGPGCGFHLDAWEKSGGDTCMEEHAAGAVGYAWIAAYEAKRRGWGASARFAVAASQQIDAAFSTADSICINDYNEPTAPYGRGPCNVDVSAVDPQTRMNVLTAKLVPDASGRTRADILAYNRGENIVYGAGQLTVIGGALIGLEEAGFQRSLASDQQLIAAALVDEAQRKSDPGGNAFKADCATVTIVNGGAYRLNDVNGCVEGPTVPRIFNLNSRTTRSGGAASFWERYLQERTPRATVVDHWISSGQHNYAEQGAFPFNEFDASRFTTDANNGDLGPGRRATYGTLGWSWHTVDPFRDANAPWTPTSDFRPRLWGYLDENDPKGWVSIMDFGGGVGGTVYGWGCDRDRPDAQIKVEVFAEARGYRVKVAEGWTIYESEPAVNAECGGGFVHRYTIPIPEWTRGWQISADGIDATWRGRTTFAAFYCNQLYSCTW